MMTQGRNERIRLSILQDGLELPGVVHGVAIQVTVEVDVDRRTYIDPALDPLRICL